MHIQCNPDIRDPYIREIASGPKSEPVLPKQNRPKTDIRDFSGPDYSLISGLHCISNIYDLVWFYGISTILGYLMPNPLFTYISNIYL